MPSQKYFSPSRGAGKSKKRTIIKKRKSTKGKKRVTKK